MKNPARRLSRFACFLWPAVAATWLAAAVTVLSSCSSKDKDVLFHAMDLEPYVSLDPSIEQSNGTVILHNVYETLTFYDDKTMRVRPCLATSWTSNGTMTEWTFRLRDDVFFHDGEALSAQAVKASIERTVRLGAGASYIWDCLESIEAADRLTVIFKLKYAGLLPVIASSSSAAYIFSPKAVDKPESWFNEGNDAGSGPYRIAAASKNSVALEAFMSYRSAWNKKKFKKIFVENVPDRNRRTDYLEEGEAGIVYSPDLDRVGRMKGVELNMNSSWVSVVMMFNTQKSPCSDEDFRKALAYAFPSSEVLGSVLDGRGKLSKGMLPAGMWGHDDSLPSYGDDMDKAREHLKKSGLEGAAVTLTYQPGRTELNAVMDLYRQRLAKIGVNLMPLRTDWAKQREIAVREDERERQDVLVMDWWPDYANPDGTFCPLLAEQDLENGFNYCYLNDAEIQHYIRTAGMLAPNNQDEAVLMYGEVQRRVLDKCYLLFLYDMATPVAVRPGLGRVRINPAYENAIYYHDIEKRRR